MSSLGFRGFILFFLLLLSEAIFSASRPSCYELFHQLRHQRFGGRHHEILKAAGTDVPLAYAQEKEGLNYTDIDHWWDEVEPGYLHRALWIRLHAEIKETKLDSETGKPARDLLDFLDGYIRDKYAPYSIRKRMSEGAWRKLSYEERLRFLFEGPGFSARVSRQGVNELFVTGILNYDHLIASDVKPPFVEVGDDLGSYELRTRGEINRRRYWAQQKVIEDFLDAKIGHQHLFHAWPSRKPEREKLAGGYIELLDATTHFLYWRQARRDPEDMDQDSVTWLRFSGLYTRTDLDFLAGSLIDGTPETFQRKYRMIGARAFRGRDEMPGQTSTRHYPDFELRSGNSSAKREFTHDMLSARLASGDYQGLRDFRDYRFDPAASIEQIAFYLEPDDQQALKQFEEALPDLRSDNRGMKRDIRNKIVAPLLPWGTRIPMDYKRHTLRQAQLVYGQELAEIAADYVSRKKRTTKEDSLESLWEETQTDIEDAIYRFANRVRLDEDFERYLTPLPDKLPDLTFPSTGDFDVNEVALGVEFSYRFPESPVDKEAASKRLKETAIALSEAFGGTEVQAEKDQNGHGHGLGVKFYFHTPKLNDSGEVELEKHRIEWDGVLRGYRNGVPFWPRGGHAEIPSPKMTPEDTSYIETLYRVNRELGQVPRRTAGGAHINIDLTPFFEMGEAGPRKIVDFINLFESNREMIQFLWQHPFRERVAIPVKLSPKLVRGLNHFDGDWEALAKLLYKERYLNPFVSRKPGYTQLNATALFVSEVPEHFQKSIDIKNPETQWFPAFGGKGRDRVEFRMFDAAPDEYIAALQIKYIRALLNQVFNQSGPRPLQKRYTAEDVLRWKAEPPAFFEAANAHLREWGLDPKEFRPLVAEAPAIQSAVPSSKEDLSPYLGF